MLAGESMKNTRAFAQAGPGRKADLPRVALHYACMSHLGDRPFVEYSAPRAWALGIGRRRNQPACLGSSVGRLGQTVGTFQVVLEEYRHPGIEHSQMHRTAPDQRRSCLQPG